MKRLLLLTFPVAAICLCVSSPPSAGAGILQQLHPTKSTGAKGSSAPDAQPDRVLFDKAMASMKKGRYDVARLDLETLLNTYPESEYQMRAKLAVGDSWFQEGGTAALAQAESEYKDFITFFPNQPEAAEAQMRVADIYYMQMEKPDRDHTNADRAEQEYRTMIQQFPDSPLVPRAKQRLREVQEVLADRQYEIGNFYYGRDNWPGAIARLQNLTERYPLYSHSDLALLNLGDSFAGEARNVQTLNIAPSAKQALIKAYDDRAADAYTRVVTVYAMAPHVEDARERLIAMNRPIPEPSQQEMAESEATEQSRTSMSLKERAISLVKHGPMTINAARVGDPTLADTPEITAPDVNKENVAMFSAALAGKPVVVPTPGSAAEVASQGNGAAGAADGGGESLQLDSAPSAGGASPAIGASIVNDDAAGSAGTANPGDSSAAGQGTAPGADAGAAPADQGAAQGSVPGATGPTRGTAAADQANGSTNVDNAGAGAAAAAAGVPGAQNPGGLAPVGPVSTALPPVDKPADAAMQINDVHGANAAQVQTGTSSGAKKKPTEPKYKNGEESSSKHKPKKGLSKINPF